MGWRFLKRRLHVSWMIAFGCLGIVIGVAATQMIVDELFVSISWLLTGIGLLLTAMWRGRAVCVIMAVFGGCIIGLWRGSVGAVDSVIYDRAIGSIVTLRGTVAEDIDTNARNQAVLRLRNIALNERPVEGSIWVTTGQARDIRRSDVVTLRGKLSEGFGSFAASAYSAEVRSVERPVPGDIALTVRDRFADGVREAIAEPESSLGLGYLVGQRRGLPESLDVALKAAGLTHIVVASGYNLTILVRFARRLFERISKFISFVVAGGMICGFVAITGLSPSMSRAGLVAGLSLLAWYYGRRFHPLVLLPFAAAVTVMIQPSYAWGDIGWQLSFAAFAGVMIMAPLIQAYLYGDKPERPIRRIFVETISAQIWTVPILLVAFGQISVIAPVANLLILPFVPLAMLLTFIAGLGGLFLPAIAVGVGLPASLVLQYMTTSATYIGNLPWALKELQIMPQVAVLLYVLIAGSCLYMWHRTRLRLERTSLIE